MQSLDPPSLPPFKLQLKTGCPIMCLRNIQPRIGLCNGTRLMVLQVATKVIEARIISGRHAGDPVFIPRITLQPSVSETPFPMARTQFPVRLAFAMTINKSQGQSVKFVGIDLRNHVFSHGQLYVALSRCTSSNRISVLLSPEDDNTTTNVVYPEVLQ
ncbi:Pif1 helicase [Thalictrum thalictroides]|uniref:Pif1 helicase n=1 Tax=Thalictrum thalictroides TaxID=46969 RepID=A0A7J6US73_THATH|nr:Pif1 helicase [Thalictrum thalictroides]